MAFFSWLLVWVILFPCWVHTFLGHIRVYRPLVDHFDQRFSKATMMVVWHFTTFFFFLVLGLALYLALAMPAWSQIALGFLAILFSGLIGIFLGVSKAVYGVWSRMPQPYILWPIPPVATLGVFFEFEVSRLDVLAWTAAGVLLLLALLHFFWFTGSPWPAKNRKSLTELVVGIDGPFPSKAATLAVVALLLVAAFTVIAHQSHVIWVYLGWSITSIFGLRGLAGFLEPKLRPTSQSFPYAHWNRVLYSPLCLLLASLLIALYLGL